MNANYEVVEMRRSTFDHVNFGGLRLVGRRRSWRWRFAHGCNYYSICDWAFGHSKQRYAFEALLEVRLNSQWVRRLRENLEQLVVRQEEEPREYQALLLEILVEAFLHRFEHFLNSKDSQMQIFSLQYEYHTVVDLGKLNIQ